MAKHKFIFLLARRLLAAVAVIALAACSNSPQAQRYLATRDAATVTAQAAAAQVNVSPTPLVKATVAASVDGIRGDVADASRIRSAAQAAQSDDWQLPSALIGALVLALLIAIGLRIMHINGRDDVAAFGMRIKDGEQ